jgi:hypothetical protein
VLEGVRLSRHQNEDEDIGRPTAADQ